MSVSELTGEIFSGRFILPITKRRRSGEKMDTTGRWTRFCAFTLGLLAVLSLFTAAEATAQNYIRKNGSIIGSFDGSYIRLNGSIAGEYDGNYVRKSGSIVGQIDESGYIRENGSIVGQIDGDYIRKNGSIEYQFDSSGYVRKNGSIYLQIDGYDGSDGMKKSIAAYLFFFDK